MVHGEAPGSRPASGRSGAQQPGSEEHGRLEHKEEVVKNDGAGSAEVSERLLKNEDVVMKDAHPPAERAYENRVSHAGQLHEGHKSYDIVVENREGHGRTVPEGEAREEVSSTHARDNPGVIQRVLGVLMPSETGSPTAIEGNEKQIRHLRRAQTELQRNLHESQHQYANLVNQYHVLEGKLRAAEQAHAHDSAAMQRELAHARAENAQLRKQVDAHNDAVAKRMDKEGVYDHTIDQVSEAEVMQNGPSSVARFNDLIDEVVTNLMEEAKLVRQPLPEGEAPPSSDRPDTQNRLTSAISAPGVDEEKSELLLDACLHDHLVRRLYNTFFIGHVATWNFEHSGDAIESLYTMLSQQEPWATTQRWRSLTAVAIASHVKANQWAEGVNRRASRLLDIIECKYYFTPEAKNELHRRTIEALVPVYNMAHTLLVIIKRDILSVRMSIIVSGASLAPAFSEPVWPEMPSSPEDTLVGAYSFGLTKLAPGTSKESVIISAKAITTALLKYADVKVSQ